MTTPEDKSRWNPSEENRQRYNVVILLVQFLVMLAASLVELVFRAGHCQNNSVRRNLNKAPQTVEPTGPPRAGGRL